MIFNRLDRYILKELISPFLLGIFILTSILIIQQVLSLMEMVINKGIGFLSVGALFLNLLPSFFLMTIPMAVMMASVTTFNRLSSDNEIIALNATGIGFSALLRPVAIFAVVIAFLTLSMGMMAGPSRRSLKNLAMNLLLERASLGLEEGRFNGIFPKMMIYVKSMPSFSELEGVFIYDQRNSEIPTVIVSRKGILVNDHKAETIRLHLTDGSLHQGARKGTRHHRLVFAEYDLKIDVSSLVKKTKPVERPSSLAEINKSIKSAEKPDVQALRMLSDYYKRYVFSLTAFIFCVIGLPLGIISGRISRVGGFAMGIAIITLSYMLMMLGDYLISVQWVTPIIAAFLPVIMLLPFCIYFLKTVWQNASPTIFGISSKRP